MSEKYLACQIIKETSSMRVVMGKLMDGTSFSINVPYWDVVAVKDSPIQAGWLLVTVLGEDLENNKSTVRLSAPDLKLGHNVCVSNADLRQVMDINPTY
ncbi:MAG: hypothetical protein M0R80_02555 [Proteobacteria bacterium]|jgi:hypothetical protein|nr:hypothetical protein [Pseudomonadota bacterium]